MHDQGVGKQGLDQADAEEIVGALVGHQGGRGEQGGAARAVGICQPRELRGGGAGQGRREWQQLAADDARQQRQLAAGAHVRMAGEQLLGERRPGA